MDVNDELDEDEMGKLPLRLQYFEKSREPNELVRQKLIETLFQVCYVLVPLPHFSQCSLYFRRRQKKRGAKKISA